MMAENPLKTALDFDDVDLDANRDGAMTEKQRLALRRKRWQILWNPGAFAFAFWVLVASYVCWNQIGKGDLLGLVVFILFVVGMGGLAIMLLSRWMTPIDSDLREGVVSGISGQVLLDVQPWPRYGITCTLRIQDVRFEIKKPVMLAFHNGEHYRVYYAAQSKTLLSADTSKKQPDRA